MTKLHRGWAPVLLLALSACGGGGGGSSGGAENRAPTANFAFSCTDLACTFTSNSTDQDVGDAVVSFNWGFGDATAAGTGPAPVHTFAAAGSYDVNLTVGDRSGATSSIVRRVTVTAPAVPGPHANFTVACVSLDCTFTDTTTFDAGSAFQSRSWDFGDSTAPGAGSPVTHSYTATTLTTVSARLTVTDTGGKTSTSVQSVLVVPPATSLNCVGSAGGGTCTLTLTTASRVSAGLLSHSCAAQGNRFIVTAPVQQVIFPDGCTDPVGSVVTLTNGGGPFAANTQFQFAVVSGTVPATTLAFQPAIRVSGDFASGWTLTFDDGFGGPGEPDFNDLVIVIKATP